MLGRLALLFNGRIHMLPAHQFKSSIVQTIHYKRALHRHLLSFSTIIVLFLENLVCCLII